MVASLWPGSLLFLFLELCLPVFLCLVHQGFCKIFSASRYFDLDGLDLHYSSQTVALPGYLILVLALDDIASWFTFSVSDSPGSLPSQLISSRSQGIWTTSWGFCHPWGYTAFTDEAFFRSPLGNASRTYSKPGIFNLWGFPRMLTSLGPGLQQHLIQGICPTGYLFPILTTRP